MGGRFLRGDSEPRVTRNPLFFLTVRLIASQWLARSVSADRLDTVPRLMRLWILTEQPMIGDDNKV
ncbi:hypothetical protein GQ44DRAFT_708336 [Phaeosphaeriaceae sp. PMI808]|nr:hypothetical protein GQ44DRAFT_708336 [Phaeosphaeriaceae sp. PMI808]